MHQSIRSASAPAATVGLAAMRPDGRAALRLTAYLGQRFAAYRQACVDHGATWDRASGSNSVPLERLAGLLVALAGAGLPFALDPDVAGALAELRQGAIERRDAAREALAAILAELPAGQKLYRYQEEGVAFLSGRARACLGDDMGLGKTVQAICALPRRGPLPGVVVIAPANLGPNWAREIKRWAPQYRARRVGSLDFAWPGPGELVIGSWDNLMAAPGEEDEGGLPFEPPMPRGETWVVVDEAHRGKNPRARRSKRAKAIIDAALETGGRAWIMTGTPLLNTPRELWDVLELAGLGQEAFGSLRQYQALVWRAGGRSQGAVTDMEAGELAQALRRVMLRRLKVDVLPDLPSKRRTVLSVPISAEQIEQGLAELAPLFEAKGLTVDGFLGLLAETQDQVPFELLSRVKNLLAIAKIPAALEVAEEYEEAGEPLVVMSDHTAVVEAFAARTGWVRLDGQQTREQNQAAVDAFQAGLACGIACNITAGGVGWTLTAASTVLFVDRNWVPANVIQAEDRVNRIGQTRPVQIVTLVADHYVDERISEATERKLRHYEELDRSAVGEGQELGAPSPEDRLADSVELTTEMLLEIAGQSAALAVEAEAAGASHSSIAVRSGNAQPPQHVQRAERRPANGAREAAAAQALLRLAAMDPDRAGTINGEGFSKYDGEIGHSLAKQIHGAGLLTDRQWGVVVKMAHKYRRQTGELPA